MDRPLRRWVPVLVLGATTALHAVWFEPLLDGRSRPMGFDYAYFLPRLLGDFQWFRLNGYWSVPWFTPAFCGGIPDWANPQSMPYSLPQWLVFFVDPVRAVQIAFAVYSLAGAAGMFLLLRRGFGTSVESALLGAVVFQFNGFFLARMIVGHVPFGLFMFTPWVAWLTVRQKIVDAVLAGILLAAFVHGGAVLLLFPVGIACAAVGLIHAMKTGQPRKGVLRFLLMAGSIGVLLSASKLMASASFAALFPRDMYPIPMYRTGFGFLRAAATGLFWRPEPVVAADMIDAPTVPGVQENEYTLSPVPLILIAIWLALYARELPGWLKKSALLVAVLMVPVAFNLHADGWIHVLKAAPVLKSTATFYRWLAAYLPVLAVLAALALDGLPARKTLAVLGMVGAITFALTGRRDVYYAAKWDPVNVVRQWNDDHSTGKVPVIESIHLPKPGVDRRAEDSLTFGESNGRCYEPMFGYWDEKLPNGNLHAGPAPGDGQDGRLNVNNPACFLYPAENSCKPGDAYRGEDRTDAEAFLNWEPVPFRLPLRQRIADWINLLAVIAVPLWLLARSLALRNQVVGGGGGRGV